MKNRSLIIATLILFSLNSCSFFYNNSYYEPNPLAKKIGEEILANPKIVLEIEKYYPELYHKEIYAIFGFDKYEERLDLYNRIIEFKNIDEAYDVFPYNIGSFNYRIPPYKLIPQKYRSSNDTNVAVTFVKQKANKSFDVELIIVNGKYYMFCVRAGIHLMGG